MESYGVIAERLELYADEAKSRLKKMARRHLLWSDMNEGKPRFRLAPWVIGIYEAQPENMDHQFAHLV